VRRRDHNGGGQLRVTLPTTGSALGALLGNYLAHKFEPTDPADAAALITACTTLGTALAHYLARRLDPP